MKEDRLIVRGGALPSPPDDRDYQFCDIIVGTGTLPDTYVNPYLNELSSISLNQGSTLECVCCAVAHLKWLIERKQNGNKKMFSPSYLYGNHTWDDAETGGCYPRCVLSQHIKYGICHFEDFPKWYMSKPLANYEYRQNKDRLDELAYPYRSNSYYCCNGIDTIKRAILLRGGVVVCVPVYLTLAYDYNKIIKMPDNTSIINGYHAMTIVGWDDSKNAWLVLNSYGNAYTDLDNNTTGKVPYLYLDYNYKIVESYTLVDDINEVKQEEEDMFTDIENHWAKESIEKAYNKSVVDGFDDGTFKPDEPMTRAQICVILDRLGLLE